jgi:hypothetical protein
MTCYSSHLENMNTDAKETICGVCQEGMWNTHTVVDQAAARSCVNPSRIILIGNYSG